jgi:hypothetical protein
MIIENLSREEMINFIKRYCVKVIKDIPGTNFKAGEYYRVYQDEGGGALIDDKGNWFDFFDLHNPSEYLEGKK